MPESSVCTLLGILFNDFTISKELCICNFWIWIIIGKLKFSFEGFWSDLKILSLFFFIHFLLTSPSKKCYLNKITTWQFSIFIKILNPKLPSFQRTLPIFTQTENSLQALETMFPHLPRQIFCWISDVVVFQIWTDHKSLSSYSITKALNPVFN